MDPVMESVVQSDMKSWSQTRNMPCTQACTQSITDSSAYSTMESSTDNTTKYVRCQLGFSQLQIAILSVVKWSQTVISYQQIAKCITGGYYLKTTEGAVRGAMERLFTIQADSENS